MLNNMKILIGLLIIIAGLAFWVLQQHDRVDLNHNQTLIPEWQENNQLINTIDQVILSKNGESIVMKKDADHWQLNGGFFVSMEPLSTLFQAFMDARIIEAKTANPANHARVELADTDLKVTLMSAENTIESMHIGKTTASGLTFLRHEGEDQTFTVQGINPVSFNRDSWELKTVLDYAANDLLSVELDSVTDDKVMISRDLESGSWELANIPADFKLKDAANLGELASGLSRFMIDQALPVNVSEEDLQLTAKYQIQDGSEVTIKVFKPEDLYFITIDSSKHPHYQGWMMQIAEYKFNAMNRTMAEYIESDVLSSTTENDAVVD